MSASNNKVWYAVLGIGALVTGAVVYHLISNNKSSQSDILEDVEALGEPKKDSRGILTFQYFKDIFILAQKHAKLKFAEAKQELLIKRRKAHQSGNEAEYGEIIKEAMQKEEMAF